MIDIYVNGCGTCGVNGLYIGRIKKVHGEVTVHNSTRLANRVSHIEFLKQAGIELSNVPSIIVINNGKRIMRLEEWKSI